MEVHIYSLILWLEKVVLTFSYCCCNLFLVMWCFIIAVYFIVAFDLSGVVHTKISVKYCCKTHASAVVVTAAVAEHSINIVAFVVASGDVTTITIAAIAIADAPHAAHVAAASGVVTVLLYSSSPISAPVVVAVVTVPANHSCCS